MRLTRSTSNYDQWNWNAHLRALIGAAISAETSRTRWILGDVAGAGVCFRPASNSRQHPCLCGVQPGSNAQNERAKAQRARSVAMPALVVEFSRGVLNASFNVQPIYVGDHVVKIADKQVPTLASPAAHEPKWIALLFIPFAHETPPPFPC